MTIVLADAPVAARAGRESQARDRLAVWLIAGPLVLLALAAILAPLLPLADPNHQVLAESLRRPVLWGGSWAHPLGTDKLGRDLLARLVDGGRVALLLGVAGTLAGLVPGVAVGLLAGYRGGWIDAVASRVIDAWLAIPGLLFAIVILVGTDRGLGVLTFVLALLTWALYARVVRAEAIALRHRPFVTALRAAGVPTWRIIGNHLVRNVASTVIVLGALQLGGTILIESGLSFLGMGVVSPQISWGGMLAEGRDSIRRAWWLSAFPGLAISFTVVLTNLLGDTLRRRLDPRTRRF
jgi:peptide/nickel transport system permease protein